MKEKLEEIPKPVIPDFIIKNGNGVMGNDGMYYHFIEVINLIKLYEKKIRKELKMNELYEIRTSLENQIESFFGDEQNYFGDEGYQDLLERLDEVNSEIEELENKENN